MRWARTGWAIDCVCSNFIKNCSYSYPYPSALTVYKGKIWQALSTRAWIKKDGEDDYKDCWCDQRWNVIVRKCNIVCVRCRLQVIGSEQENEREKRKERESMYLFDQLRVSLFTLVICSRSVESTLWTILRGEEGEFNFQKREKHRLFYYADAGMMTRRDDRVGRVENTLFINRADATESIMNGIDTCWYMYVCSYRYKMCVYI